MVQVLVKTTMSAKESLISSGAAETTQLRGSLNSETSNKAPVFMESMRTMVQNALQDPRQ